MNEAVLAVVLWSSTEEYFLSEDDVASKIQIKSTFAISAIGHDHHSITSIFSSIRGRASFWIVIQPKYLELFCDFFHIHLEIDLIQSCG